MADQTSAIVRRMPSQHVARVRGTMDNAPLLRPFGAAVKGDRVASLSTLYDFFIDNVPDPDSALAQNPQFDELIRMQPDVHACMRLRELTVASMPARVEKSSAKGIDGEAAQKVADYVGDVLDALPNKVDLYRQMQNAVLMGGQGIEFVWQRVDGFERPVSYMPIHKSRFCFDRLGNMALLTREFPVYGVYIARAQNKFPDMTLQEAMKAFRKTANDEYIVPAIGGKFLYHKYMAEGGPWTRPASEGYLYWGRGEDTHLYLPVTFDQFVLRFRMKWLEKHGMPLTVLYYADSERVTSEVLKIANSIREEGVVLVPKMAGENGNDHWYHLEFQEPPAQGYDAFDQFSQNWTKPVVQKILLGGANLMELGDSGSYSATVGQRDAGADIIFRYDAKNIDETINSQLIPYIVWAHWPGLPVRYMPKHVMEPKNQVDQETRVRTLKEVATAVPVREADFYDAAGIDKPKDEEETVFLGQSEMDSAFDGFPPTGGGGDEPGLPPKGGKPGQAPGGSPPKSGTKPPKKGSIGSGRPRTPVGGGR